MKKNLVKLTVALFVLASALLVSSCGNTQATSGASVSAASSEEQTTSAVGSQKSIKIAVPNDTTNEARALLLLQANELIKLRDDAGIAATPRDIVENPYNIEFF